jgi:hypothetical protein
MGKQLRDKKVIITTSFRGVYYRRLVWLRDNACMLADARMVIYWGTRTGACHQQSWEWLLARGDAPCTEAEVIETAEPDWVARLCCGDGDGYGGGGRSFCGQYQQGGTST